MWSVFSTQRQELHQALTIWGLKTSQTWGIAAEGVREGGIEGQSCIYLFYYPLYNNLSTSLEQSWRIQRKSPAMSSPFAGNTQWVMAFTCSLFFPCPPKIRAI